jgi:hypothetical protein
MMNPKKLCRAALRTLYTPLAFALAASPVWAQDADEPGADTGNTSAPARIADRNMAFERLAAPKNVPATLLLKNLNKDWRRMTLEGDQGGNSMAYMYGYGGNNPLMREAMADIGIGVYFTRFQSITLGDETYLVAYRIDNNLTQQEIQDAMRQVYGHHGNQPPVMGQRRFARDTALKLSLLNLRSVGSFTDIRAFDAAREIMSPADIIEASNDNLRRIGGYLVGQASQFDRYGRGGLPLASIAAARQAFQNFFHAPLTIFAHPETREPYRPNTLLANRRMATLGNRAQLAAFYEAKPGSDGKRGVLFLNGKVERVPEWKWARIKATKPAGISAAQTHTLSFKAMQTLNRQLLQYARNRNGGLLPQMADASSFKRLMQRSGYYASEYEHPISRKAYRPNPVLSGRALAKIENLARLVSLYEPEVGADGKRGVIYLDGHFARVPNSRWNEIKNTPVRLKGEKRSARRSTS